MKAGALVLFFIVAVAIASVTGGGSKAEPGATPTPTLDGMERDIMAVRDCDELRRRLDWYKTEMDMIQPDTEAKLAEFERWRRYSGLAFQQFEAHCT